MSLHFQTEQEAILDRYAAISPVVLAAVENNKAEFIQLLLKIYGDLKGEMIKVNVLSPEQAKKHKGLAETETKDIPISSELLDEIKALMLGTYLISFLIQGHSYLGPTIKVAHDNGVEDGYAYSQVKAMAKN